MVPVLLVEKEYDTTPEIKYPKEAAVYRSCFVSSFKCHPRFCVSVRECDHDDDKVLNRCVEWEKAPLS